MTKVANATEMRAGRVLGVLLQTDKRDRGYLFIRGRDNVDYFAHKAVFPPVLYANAKDGDAVSFRAAMTTKGMRAFDVEAVTPLQQAVVDEQEENRGNQ